MQASSVCIHWQVGQTKTKLDKNEEDKEIRELSDQRKTIKTKINVCRSQDTKSKLKEEPKTLKKEINKKLKEKEEEKLDKQMENLENVKDDNTKYFYVLREMQNSNTNKKLLKIQNNDIFDHQEIFSSAIKKIVKLQQQSELK